MLTGRFRGRAMIDDVDDPRAAHVIARAQAGDRDAVHVLYVRYADSVYGYVGSIVRDDHEAEDVTQAVFAKLLSAIDRYEPRVAPFSAWILRVARNVALDHLRQRRPLPCDEVRAPEAPLEETGAEQARALRAALAELSDDQREVVVLRHLVGLAPGEIAERLARSESAVHGLDHRGRRRLRQALVDLVAGPVLHTAAA